MEKGVLKNYKKFTGRHLCWSLFFNKIAGLRAFNFIKKKYQRSCFPVKVAKFFRAPTFKNIREQLLLYLHVILFTIHETDTANTMRD